MSFLRDLRESFCVLARSVRTLQAPHKALGYFLMSLFQHRRYAAPPDPFDDEDAMAGPSAASDALVTIAVELLETGMEVRRSGLAAGDVVNLNDIPEDVAAPGGTRFQLALTIRRLGLNGAALAVETGGEARDLVCLYDERVDTGLRSPSGHTIAVGMAALVTP